jgi:predicted ester cyclase
MKKIIPLSLAIMFLISSCVQNKADKVKLDQMMAKLSTETLNKAIVQKYLDGLNKNDTTLYASLFADVYVPETKLFAPAGGPKFMNYSENLKAQKSTYIAVPDAHWEIVDMAADGNLVMTRLWTTGTNTGSLSGLPPTGNKLEFSNTVTFKIENGKIIEQREDYDQLSMMLQFGFELIPPTVAKK